MITPGKSIARLRAAKGWTIYRLAVESGVDQAAIGRVERGKASMRIDAAVKLADALAVSLDELVGRKTPTTTEERR